MARDIVKVGDLSNKDFSGASNQLRIKQPVFFLDETGGNAPVVGASPVNPPATPKDYAFALEMFDDIIRFWTYSATGSSWTFEGSELVRGATSVITPTLASGQWVHNDGKGTVQTIRSVDTGDASNLVTVNATNGGAYIEKPQIRVISDSGGNVGTSVAVAGSYYTVDFDSAASSEGSGFSQSSGTFTYSGNATRFVQLSFQGTLNAIGGGGPVSTRWVLGETEIVGSELIQNDPSTEGLAITSIIHVEMSENDTVRFELSNGTTTGNHIFSDCQVTVRSLIL